MLKLPIILQKLSLIHSYSRAFPYMGSMDDLSEYCASESHICTCLNEQLWFYASKVLSVLN